MQTAIIFAQFGPYHHARVKAFQGRCPGEIVAVQIAAGTDTYAWEDSGSQSSCDNVQTLCPGKIESQGFWSTFFAARRFFREQKIEAAFLPSYSPMPQAGVWAAAKSLGLLAIMMNESHAGTGRAKGLMRLLKRAIVRSFDAALVGGAPQKRHFANLGLPEERIFTGYDAIDNDHFASAAENARRDCSLVRKKLGLPERYFLSLGRMVEKKNLGLLIESYASFCMESDEPVALVMVGSGAEEPGIREQAARLNLRVIDGMTLSETDREGLTKGDVIFYGFRQIHENPLFFALAEMFILPSLWEEWGLVVNEAMACGLPVLVSRTAGCAEDLVVDGENGFTFDPKSPDQLSRHLCGLAVDYEKRRSLGQCSRERISHWGCDFFAENADRARKAALESVGRR